ncbi:hypothetical protein V5799_013674 [Amblyomma americanum]|uniref:Mos1 transposase HTH domain-containing protein n=1 Tax=Amblyomma americanum TaxID=6943 RepID=A0AAQ4E574_AMBAM
MVANSVNIYMEKRVGLKFLLNEGIKPAEIYRSLQAQYGDDIRSRRKTFEWRKRFKDIRTSITDDPGRGGSPPMVVIPENTQCVEKLIVDNRRITCREISRSQEAAVTAAAAHTVAKAKASAVRQQAAAALQHAASPPQKMAAVIAELRGED